MSRVETIFPAAIFVVVAALLLFARFVFDYSWAVMAFPFIAGAAVCGLCLLDIATTLKQPAPAAERAENRPEPISLASLAWALSLTVFVYAFGFVFGPALYLLIYLRVHGSSWLFSLSVAGLSLAVTWGLFINILRILLPMQPLWWNW